MLIFDFDGTLADSLLPLLDSVNNNADYYKYKKIDAIEPLRGKDAQAIIKEIGITTFKLPFVVNTIRNEMRAKMHLLKPFPGVSEAVTQLHENGISMSIVTSNSKGNVELFLRNHTMDFFQHIHGESSIFGKSKVIKNFLRTHNINAANAIYIGDETRDIEAAKSNGIKSAAVSWGFNSTQKLQESNPDYILSNPNELISLFT